jgi:DNA-binding CsgD family transcriptional regulator
VTKDELEMRLIGLEAKVDALFQLIGTGGSGRGQSEDDPSSVGELSNLTKKQHQALQLLITGARNNDIAKAMGCTVNTAKVHVRTIASKFGVHSRSQIALMGKGMIDGVSDEMYKSIAGVEKQWALKACK